MTSVTIEPTAFPAEEAAMRATWAPARGFLGWFTETDHKHIGIRYVVTALCFFALAGLEAAVIRIQLSKPGNDFVSNDFYNQLFTMHGTTMMFLFAVPIMEGMGLYLLPLMVGTRNVAFPKMNAFGYYIYLFGGLFIYTMFFLGAGADAGWFSYVPLAGPEFSPGKRVDTWAQMITYTEISALVVAIELSVTAFKQRAPGMSLNRIPMFVWAMIVVSLMILFAMPAVMLDSTFLAMDRLVSTHFFNKPEGGDPLLYQHMFWFFGHPEVYIIFLPGLGLMSEIIVTFTRRTLFAKPVMVTSLVFTGFMAFGLWVHHMFATGLPQLGQSFFTAASIMISLPTGVQIFCWIATIWRGALRLVTPMLFVIGFFVTFIIGGLTGVFLAAVPADWQLHDTFFVVAHLHYVLIGGAFFPLFGALYYWYPKWSGRMYHETAGKVSFWLILIGFNTTFFPMHFLGFLGMPRRVYTYSAQMGWTTLNQVASAGAAVLASGIAVMLVNFLVSRRTGAVAGANPWDADTLEWSTSSPPPPYNYLHLPTVAGDNPLWDKAHDQPVVVGTRTDVREVLVTRVLDAEPDHREEIPGHSIIPFLLALAVGISLCGVIFFAWWFVIGAVLAGVLMIFWFWPKRETVIDHLQRERPQPAAEALP
jgi:cytochrome c oxidase subunit 1